MTNGVLLEIIPEPSKLLGTRYTATSGNRLSVVEHDTSGGITVGAVAVDG